MVETYKEIYKHIESGKRVKVFPKIHKNIKNSFDGSRFNYFIDFDIEWDEERISLPNIPGTSQEKEIKESGLSNYINQYVITGTNIKELRQEVRDNWNKEHWILSYKDLNVPSYML